MGVPVAVFNASSQSITITINNGPQISVSGTGPAQNWNPQTQAPGTGPSYSPGHPAPNVIGNMGSNQVMAYVNGMPIGNGPFSFTLPNRYPVGSVQLYLFFATIQNASWMLLTDGMLAAQQMLAGAAQAPETETK